MIKCRLYSSVNPWGLKPSWAALALLSSNCLSILQNGSKKAEIIKPVRYNLFDVHKRPRIWGKKRTNV